MGRQPPSDDTTSSIKRLKTVTLFAQRQVLLIRTAHGVKPTQYAEELQPSVSCALTGLEATITPKTFDVSRAKTTFQMAMADATAALWMPSLVRTIEREAPEVHIRMVPLTTRDPRQMLMRGDVDLTVGFSPGVTAQLPAVRLLPPDPSIMSGYTQVNCLCNAQRPSARSVPADNR